MTQIEERLRSALADAPTPTTAITDPLADLQRRIGRARLRLAAGAVSVTAAVVAAVVVPVIVLGGTDRKPAPVAGPVEVPATTWQRSYVPSAVSGAGYVWTTVEQDRAHRAVELVQRRDPVTGKVLGTTALPAPFEFLTFGLREVWAWGGGDGAYPVGRIAEVSPTGQVRSNVPLGNGLGLTTLADSTGQAMAFFKGRAYGVRENGNVVDTFVRGRPEFARSHHVRIPGAVRLFTQDQYVFVVGRRGVIGQLTFDAHGVADGMAPAATDLGLPLAAVPNVGMWTWTNGVLRLVGEDGAPLGPAVSLPAQPTAAVLDPSGDLYVAMNQRGSDKTDLLYYPAKALAAPSPKPAATHHGHGVDNLALDPAGGVVTQALNNGPGLQRWDPSAAGLGGGGGSGI